MSEPSVVITGAAQTPFNRRKDGTGFRDWAFDAFGACLEKACLERRDIDAFFFASESDFFTHQLNPASVLATELGLTGVSITRCEGGGASGQLAVHAAVRAIQSGKINHALVIGTDPSASCLPSSQVKELYGFSFDAWTDGMSGVSSTSLYALSYLAFMERHLIDENALAEITLQNRLNACSNPNAHLPRNDSLDEINHSAMISSPYRRLHCSPLSDGAAAVILSNGKAVASSRKNAPRIAGIGGATDDVHLGARSDPGYFKAKNIAMKKACAEADITPDQIEIAEIYDAYAGAQLQAIEALGLSDDILTDLRDGQFSPGGRCPINLSGGLMGQGAPVGAVGVAQTATCALLLEGEYHPDLQTERLPHYAVADTHGAICTTSAVTILAKGGTQ